MKRDLVGYGKNLPRVEWPESCQIAVSLVVNYEEGSELTPAYGDKRHETNGEIPSRKPPEARSLQTETQWEYGGRAGVWRLLRLFEEYEVKATFFACAMSQRPSTMTDSTSRACPWYTKTATGRNVGTR